MLDSREPPHGDFVAYVEKIEREQLARAMQPHKLPDLSSGAKAAEQRPLSATEAQRVLQSLKERSASGWPARGALIGAVIGAAMIAFGLIAEGGMILVIIGAVLLWHNLRKLIRSATAAGVAPMAARADHAFGNRLKKAAREQNR